MKKSINGSFSEEDYEDGTQFNVLPIIAEQQEMNQAKNPICKTAEEDDSECEMTSL